METAKCVKRGMALLDRYLSGWRSSVDVSKLDMCSVTDGLLEQIYGHYEIGLRNLSLTYAEAARYGFDIVGNDGDNEANVAAWKLLTAAWKAVLEPIQTV